GRNTPQRAVGRIGIKRQESEIEAQRELQIALAAAAGATTFGKHFAKCGEVGRVKADIGGAAATSVAAPVGMVPDVVSFRAELKSDGFVEWKTLEQPHVPVREAGLIDQVANTLRSERSERGGTKDSLVIAIKLRGAVRTSTRNDNHFASLKPLAVRPKRADDFGVSVEYPVLPMHAAALVRIQPSH